MPEIIDGVSYPTTTGGRPFPTSASPGKAFWQLLERYARELDDADTDMAAFQAAVNQALAAALTYPRRLLTKTAGQTGGVGTRFTWTPAAGDGGDAAGLTLASSGLLTCTRAGLWMVNLNGAWLGSAGSGQVSIRRNGTIIMSKSATSTPGLVANLSLPLVVGDTLDVNVESSSSTTATQNADPLYLTRLGA